MLAEESLPERDELFRVVTEHANDLIRLYGLDGRSVYASPSVERFYGKAPATAFDFVHPEELESCQRWWKKIVAGETERHSWRVRDAGGQWRWLETSAALVQYLHGPHVLTVCRDITDRRQAEEQARVAAERLQAVIAAAPLVLWAIDRNGFKTLSVGKLLEKWGCKQNETIGQSIFEAAKVVPNMLDAARRALNGESPSGVTTVGTEMFEWWYNPLRADDGAITGAIGVAIDVTDRKRAEDALRESRQHLHMVLTTLPVGVVVMDRAGDIVLANPASQRIWGCVIGSARERWAECKGYWHNSGERILPEGWASARALFQGQTSLNELIDIETFDGQKKTIKNSAAPIRDADGLILGAVVVNEDVTDWQQSEEALRKSERKFASLADKSLQGIAIFQGQKMVYANPAECAILGYSLGELQAMSRQQLHAIVHPLDRPISDERARRRLAGEDVNPEVELRIVRKDGATRWIQSFNNAIDFNGEPVILSTSIDVTDRKRAEESLRETTAKLNEAQRIAHLGHWEQDLDTGRVTASDETYRIFGLRPEEDLQTWAAWQEYIHPEDRPIRPAAIEEALRSGPHYEAEYRVVRPDGDVRILHSQGEVTRDETGRPRRLFGIIRDITKQRRGERALLEAERRLEHVVASSPAVLLTLRAEEGKFRNISWMSENIEAMLGYRVEETLGADWWLNNIHPEDRDAVVNQFLSDLLSRGHTTSEYRFRHKDGQYRWIRGETRLLHDAAGRPTEVVGSLSDITERMRLEDQFRQAQKMEAVGHLAAGVAHDFNNLLTIISGYSEILLPTLPPADPNRAMISQIRDAGERAAGLTRQLLAFSSQTVLEPKVVDLNGVVRENERMLRRLIGEDMRLTAVLDPALEPVKVDPGQISQVIMNLAVNARDAMPTGGNLTIETSNVKLDKASAATDAEARAGRYVRLAVTDTGAGMTPEVQAHIFEPFFTTKGPGKGTGLGLATVYGIVKQSGGFISVYSELGRGTTIKIYFPIAEGRVSSDKSSPGLKPMAGGTETILLVEDEDAVRAMVRIVLQQAGYTVLEANRGTEAIRLVGEHPGPVHLLITDVVMPEMGGRELVERLAPMWPGIKVLYLSGYTDDAVVRHGVLQADVAFLQKPFTMAALTNKVRQVLDEVAG